MNHIAHTPSRPAALLTVQALGDIEYLVKESEVLTGQAGRSFVIAGAVFGLLAGLVIGYAKDDTWNGKQKWAQEVQERKAEGQKLLDDVCRDFPNSGACKGR